MLPITAASSSGNSHSTSTGVSQPHSGSDAAGADKLAVSAEQSSAMTGVSTPEQYETSAPAVTDVDCNNSSSSYSSTRSQPAAVTGETDGDGLNTAMEMTPSTSGIEFGDMTDSYSLMTHVTGLVSAAISNSTSNVRRPSDITQPG